MDQKEQTIKQRKIALAQSEHAFAIIDLIKDCMTQVPLVADTEWKTIVNTITLDVQSTMIRDMVDHLEGIRAGKLLNPQ